MQHKFIYLFYILFFINKEEPKMIKIEGLHHKYKTKTEPALKNINLHIKKGESVVIIGSSGSGKSTLLRSINRLIEPSSGKIYVDNQDILSCSPRRAVKIRGKVGMIFQNFNLVERETVLKNVLNGRLRYNNALKTFFDIFSEKDHLIAKNCIKIVGLEGYEKERVNNLSGGQKQRVAIARAISQNPDVILADEPVSNLDPRLVAEIMNLLLKICTKKGITLITSLHYLELAKKYGSRIIGLKNGEVVFEGNAYQLSEEDILNIFGKTGF